MGGGQESRVRTCPASGAGEVKPGFARGSAPLSEAGWEAWTTPPVSHPGWFDHHGDGQRVPGVATSSSWLTLGAVCRSSRKPCRTPPGRRSSARTFVPSCHNDCDALEPISQTPGRCSTLGDVQRAPCWDHRRWTSWGSRSCFGSSQHLAHIRWWRCRRSHRIRTRQTPNAEPPTG